MLEKIISQSDIFSSLPKRSVLLSYLKSNNDLNQRSCYFRFHRNIPIELTFDVLPVFLSYQDAKGYFFLGDYGDQFSFSQTERVDIECFAFDYREWISKNNDVIPFCNFFKLRLIELKKKSPVPFLVFLSPNNDFLNFHLKEILGNIPDIFFLDMPSIYNRLGESFFDARFKSISGSDWSNQVYLLIAQNIGLLTYPYFFSQPLKVIVLDFDNTLYEGVLSEDGVQNVVLTQNHKVLQENIKYLKEKGFMLAGLSKNEEKDVINLLKTRKDFPLSFDDFTFIVANWDSKSNGLKTISEKLHVGLDSLLVLDDNLGEIQTMLSDFPQIKFVFCQNPVHALEALKLYPGLYIDPGKPIIDRTKDLQAEKKRNEIKEKNHNSDNYLKNLKTKVEIVINDFVFSKRLSEISIKTNQFNARSCRYTQTDLEKLIQSLDVNRFYAISVEDMLSKSGVVGFIHICLKNSELIVSELCLSCRILGRLLENTLIISCLKEACDFFSKNSIIIEYQKTDKNVPALKWLSQFSCVDGDVGRIVLERNQLESLRLAPIEIIVKDLVL